MDKNARIAGLRSLIQLHEAFGTTVTQLGLAYSREIGSDLTAKKVNVVIAEIEGTYRRNLRWLRDASHVVIGQLAWSDAIKTELTALVDRDGWGGHYPVPAYDPNEAAYGTPGQHFVSALFVLEQAGRDFGSVRVGEIEIVLNRLSEAG